MEINRSEFESAITKHILFKSKVRSYLYGADISLAPIVDFRACHFGHWLEDFGLPRYGHLPEMQELERVHREIHDFAVVLVNLKKTGREEEALNGIQGLNQIADRIVELLTLIPEKAEGLA